ncbi:recombinase RecJ [Halobacteriales archaeon QH_8_64_26]|nr:MAG: recombinase RecJ [Halobacteriales archaeon QH_8_64_26]
MDDHLIDDETLSIARKSVLPGEGFFYPDSFDEERADREAAVALTGAETAVIADPDADGLACVALLEVAFGDVALIGAGPHDLSEALARVGAYADPGARVFVCDLCPDSEDDLVALERLADQEEGNDGEKLRWFDHHQWDESLARTVREAGVDLVVGDSEEVCSADVVLRSLDHDFEETYRDLAAVTRDHDLWLREDPRSDDLADLAYWADPEEYIETILEHGADLPAEVEEYLAERRIEKEELIERAVDRAEFVEIGTWTVGITYGRCSQNEVAEALREQGADASVIVKPGGSASIRGSDGFERCHEVARQVEGGGHPKAAGCKPDIYEDMLDYAHHWSTRGAVTKRVIRGAFERLPESDDATNESTDR